METVDGRRTQDASVLQELARNRSASGASSHTSEQASGKAEREDRDRIAMCEFAVRCATRLLLDQASTLTALVLSQTFFTHRRKVANYKNRIPYAMERDNFVETYDRGYCFSQYDSRLIAGASVFISTKSCEVPRTLRSIANVVHAVANDTNEPMGTGSRYTNLKMSLINAEQTVLRVLDFDVDVTLPFNYLFKYAAQLKLVASTTHCAVKLASDVYFDARALALPPFVVAAASLHIASKLVEGQGVAQESKWWYLYDTR
uniref:Cyclin N-terminal domain-containing protein n=1 Tax=Globisporangium ultimum (strain ATCC 200006 / CBS 805.95 / DAOM BR144) TaxID=431595 RepID=K3WEG8_GLOUD